MQSIICEKALIKALECKSHRLYKQSISQHLLPKKNTQREGATLQESNLLSCTETTTPQLIRKVSSLLPKSQLSVKKDELFKLLKGKNISVSRSPSKQKKIKVQKYSCHVFEKETSRNQPSIVKKVAFNNQKWRFNRQRSIKKSNEEDDKLRKTKQKLFLNTRVLSQTLLNLQKSHLLRL